MGTLDFKHAYFYYAHKKHQILRITSLKFHGTCDAATDDWFYDDKTYANTVSPHNLGRQLVH